MEILEIFNAIVFYTIFCLYVVCIAHFISTIRNTLLRKV